MVIRPSGLSKILKLLGTFNRPASTRSLRGALFSCRHSTASVFLCHFEISSLIPRTTSQLAVVVLALHRTFSQAFRNNCSFLHRALNARGATLACGCDVGSRIARHNRRCMLSSTPNGATPMLRDQKRTRQQARYLCWTRSLPFLSFRVPFTYALGTNDTFLEARRSFPVSCSGGSQPALCVCFASYTFSATSSRTFSHPS
jgi:hypothetical protein